MWSKDKLADGQIHCHFPLVLLDLVDDFISNQLEHGLHHVRTTVAHICYRLKTGCDKVLVDNLQKSNRGEHVSEEVRKWVRDIIYSIDGASIQPFRGGGAAVEFYNNK